MAHSNLHRPFNRDRLRNCVELVACLVLISSNAARGAELSRTEPIADRIEQVHFTSQAFNTTKHYCVVLPIGFRRETKDRPVLFLLHGRGRTDRSLIDDAECRQALLNAPFVTVLPNGEDGWYIDSPAQPKHAYSRLLDETIRNAEQNYNLSREPKHRAIAGWSMGGYGCVRYAESHPKSFAVVIPIIGLLDFPRTGLPAGQTYDIPAKTFGSDQKAWKKFNPIHDAERLRGADILLIAADRAFDRTMNENFRNRLRELDIRHEWKMLPGDHHFDVVRQAIPIVIAYASKRFNLSSAGE